MFHQVALVRRKCNGESCRVDRSCPLYLCLYCYDALHPPMPTGVEEIDAHRLHGACSSSVFHCLSHLQYIEHQDRLCLTLFSSFFLSAFEFSQPRHRDVFVQRVPLDLQPLLLPRRGVPRCVEQLFVWVLHLLGVLVVSLVVLSQT